MSYAFRCEVCNADPDWRITRVGDVVLTWACNDHLAVICERLQRDFEITQLIVQDSREMREWAASGKSLDGIARELSRAASLDLVRPSDLAAANRTRAELKSGAARTQRTAAGVTMADVARVLGVTKQSVHYWETYQSTPTISHALAYGRLLAALARRAALPQ